MDSGSWTSLATSTRRKYELILKQMLETSGDKQFVKITSQHVLAARDRRKATPFQANNFLKAASRLFKWAVSAGHVATNPVANVESMETKTTGFHPWSEHEIEIFEAKWPLGTRERLAFDILLYTGLRRGDAARLGRQHIRNGIFTIRTEKTDQVIVAPVLPELEASIAATQTGDLSFIVGEHGRPMTKEGFGNWFSKVCDQTGVPGSAHGLRKAGATRAANNGATVAQLEAIYGWHGGGMAALYTRAANREKLAREAMDKLRIEQKPNSYAHKGVTSVGRTSKNKGKSNA
jgi:integrase